MRLLETWSKLVGFIHRILKDSFILVYSALNFLVLHSISLYVCAAVYFSIPLFRDLSSVSHGFASPTAFSALSVHLLRHTCKGFSRVDPRSGSVDWRADFVPAGEAVPGALPGSPHCGSLPMLLGLRAGVTGDFQSKQCFPAPLCCWSSVPWEVGRRSIYS